MSGKRRLLLIDSSDSARTILFKEISAAAPDLDIIACGSGKEAMTAVKRFEFEIITTGISLPDTDGYTLIEQIRQTPKNKDTAIFVVSGDTNTRVVGAGMDDTDAVTAYFDKAEGHQSLVNFILNYIGTRNEFPVKVVYVDKSATSTAPTRLGWPLPQPTITSARRSTRSIFCVTIRLKTMAAAASMSCLRISRYRAK